MKFIYKFSFLLLFIVSISSCNFKRETKTVTVEIDTYPTLAENEQFAIDILAHPKAVVLKNKFDIIDTKIKGIDSETKLANNKVKIEFTVSETVNSKELSKSFISLIEEKENYYKENAKFLKMAEKDVYIFLEWIVNSDYESLWSRTSPMMKENTSKEEFILTYQITRLFDINGKKVKTERILYKGIMPNQENMCISFYFEYANGNYVMIRVEDAGEHTNYLNFSIKNHKF